MSDQRVVVHHNKRYVVMNETDLDGDPALVLRALHPKSAGGYLAHIVARCEECREDRRHVVIRGYRKHREGRPVVMDIRQENGETHITLRLKGKRKGYTFTLEGAYDTAGRQEARNAQLALAHKRRTRRAR